MMRASLWTRLALPSTMLRLIRSTPFRRFTAGMLAAALVGGCVYRIDIQQGNVLEQEDIDQVTVGMSRSAVQFLLGTPMIEDAFHRDRWDYTYYFRQGRSRDVERRWFVVYFENDLVTRLERDVVLAPSER
jgi:outer membrane protein assembly factor BamE (lipoprotein component of BamABCDE complex)